MFYPKKYGDPLQKAPGTSSKCWTKAPRMMISCSSPARRSHERDTTKGHAWIRRQSSVLCERLPRRQVSRTGPRSLHTGCATATDRIPSIARHHSLWYATRWDTAILRSLMNMQRHARIKALLNTCLYKKRSDLQSSLHRGIVSTGDVSTPKTSSLARTA